MTKLLFAAAAMAAGLFAQYPPPYCPPHCPKPDPPRIEAPAAKVDSVPIEIALHRAAAGGDAGGFSCSYGQTKGRGDPFHPQTRHSDRINLDQDLACCVDGKKDVGCYEDWSPVPSREEKQKAAGCACRSRSLIEGYFRTIAACGPSLIRWTAKGCLDGDNNKQENQRRRGEFRS